MEIIKSCHQKAIKILGENKVKLHELTKYLLEIETISGEEFMDILYGKHVVDLVKSEFIE